MHMKEAFFRQLLGDRPPLQNAHTFIIRKDHLPPESTPPQLSELNQQRSDHPRSRSENTHPHKQRTLPRPDPHPHRSIASSPRQNDSHRIRNIRTERATPRRQHKSNEPGHKSSILSPLAVTPNKEEEDGAFRTYLECIRAGTGQEYNATARFDHYRRRGKRQGLRPQQHELFALISNNFRRIYENIGSNGDRKTLELQSKAYLHTYEKVRIEVVFSIHFPGLLQTRLRPFLVYQRQIVLGLALLARDNKIAKLSEMHRDAFRLSVQYLSESYCLLFEAIREKEETVLSRINEAFRMLKAVGEVEKKLQVVQREVKRIPAKCHPAWAQILNTLRPILTSEDFQLEQITKTEMRLSWQLLRIPPIPYLPPSNSKPYTLVIGLDQTLIHYEVESKTLKYRPYLDILMRKLEPNFEIVAFCTGTQQYSHLMAKQIEKTNHYFSYVLSEQHIIRDGITPMKDLVRLGRDMNRVVAVDCRPQQYRNFKMHGVEVRQWTGDRSDRELSRLTEMLAAMAAKNIDVRDWLRQVQTSLHLIDQQPGFEESQC